MIRARVLNLSVTLLPALVLVTGIAQGDGDERKPKLPNMAGFPNSSGVVRTYNKNGDIDLSNAFFQSLGTNGRSCGTCHQPSDAMSVSAAHVQDRFDASRGLDPIFRTNDGSNCDHNIDTSTVAGRSAAYSLLRTRGLIRIALPVPAGAEFEVMNVINPYGCGEMGTLSMYRRPLPGTNLKFLSTLMWDGRESSTQTGTTPIGSTNYPQSLLDNLRHQAVDATLGHAQGTRAPTAKQVQDIVDLEMGLFTAQAEVRGAGELDEDDARGGPRNVSRQNFFIGINDPVGLNPTNAPFTTAVFSLYDAWIYRGNPHRQSIARGQALFNTKTFTISGVAGLNMNTFPNGVTPPASLVSTCGICHDSPNAGDHSISAPLNIGIATAGDLSINPLDMSYLPRITLRKISTGEMVTTTDPGRAMITGKWADIARFKGPVLRGLAARAPYFHNGAARNLIEVVDFYDVRFAIGFTAHEKADLVAFLSAL
jgi:cytochrome c peroxidase